MTRFIPLPTFVKELERVGFMVKDLGLLDSALARPKTSFLAKMPTQRWN